MMKKTRLIFTACTMAALCVAGMWTQAAFGADRPAAQVQTQSQAARDAKAVRLITDMYNNKRYEDDRYLKKHVTNKLLKKLKAEFDYDCDEGDCYANWLFRSGMQDGPSEKYGIISVQPLGNGWYKYSFYDMGNKASNRIKIIEKNGQLMFDDIR